MEIHSLSWKLTHKLNKNLGWQMVAFVISTLGMILFFGWHLALEINRGNFNWSYLGPAIIPLYGVFFLCHACRRCAKIPSNIQAKLLRNCGFGVRKSRLVERFALQMLQQKIKFTAKGLFTFNYNFIVEIIGIVITYDVIFLQQYEY